MSEVVRDAIENKQRIKQELVLMQEDFLLNEVSKLIKPPVHIICIIIWASS